MSAEPENPEEFCKRYGVAKVKFEKHDGKRLVYKFCAKDNAFFDFKRQSTIEKVVKATEQEEMQQRRTIEYRRRQKRRSVHEDRER